jgi:alkanesulfonate monooxygenase SsuD/methylene tetrahydromethanopterin reductase-like flavin-dependent oxidoreductase (luciferase family)
MKVDRPTTVATRPMQDPLPIWLGGVSLSTMELAARHDWNIMRNFGEPQQHRDAFEQYVRLGAEHGHSLSGANFMIERFVAIADTEAQAEKNLERLARSFGRLITIFRAGGRRALPTTDAEVQARPAIAICGTPGQIATSLRQTLHETGARRLLVETFSPDEMRQFAREVLPALQKVPWRKPRTISGAARRVRRQPAQARRCTLPGPPVLATETHAPA